MGRLVIVRYVVFVILLFGFACYTYNFMYYVDRVNSVHDIISCQLGRLLAYYNDSDYEGLLLEIMMIPTYQSMLAEALLEAMFNLVLALTFLVMLVLFLLFLIKKEVENYE